jgi:hypothetical protein
VRTAETHTRRIQNLALKISIRVVSDMSRVAHRLTRCRARVGFVARVGIIALAFCWTTVARAWVLTTPTAVRRTESSVDGRNDVLEFTLRAFGETHKVEARTHVEIVADGCTSARQLTTTTKRGETRRRELSEEATGTKKINDDDFEVVPMVSSRVNAGARCQYTGRAKAVSTGEERRFVGAFCDGYVKGQIRTSHNTSVSFELANGDVSSEYLDSLSLPTGLDPLEYVVLNVSTFDTHRSGAVDTPRLREMGTLKFMDKDGHKVDAASVMTGNASLASGGREHGRRLLQSSNQRFIELVVVNDHARCEQFLGDLAALEADTLFVVNVANSLFEDAPFNPPIKLLLKEMVSFTEGDPYSLFWLGTNSVEKSTDEILDSINVWRDEYYSSLPQHDAMHLFSGVDFESSDIGLAYQFIDYGGSSICEQRTYCDQLPPGVTTGSPLLENGYCYTVSGVAYCCHHGWATAISQVWKQSSQRDAVTVAHEIGHQLGFSHDWVDNDGCSKFGDIMATHATAELEVDWSACTIGEYNAKIGDSYHQCLLSSATSGTSVCGNGIIEPGEQCDCPDNNCECYDDCCDADTCQLKSGAMCSAVNDCCDESTCTIASAGTVCRASVSSCDPAETCDGSSESCPADTILAYGTACEDSNGDPGACWANECRNREFQCQRFSPFAHGGALADFDTCGSKPNFQTAGSSSACASGNWYCASSSTTCLTSTVYYTSVEAPLGYPCSAASGGVHSNVCDGLGSCVSLSSVIPTYTGPLPNSAHQRKRSCSVDLFTLTDLGDTAASPSNNKTVSSAATPISTSATLVLAVATMMSIILQF